MVKVPQKAVARLWRRTPCAFLKRGYAAFPVANADHFFNFEHKNFAVAYLACRCAPGNGINHIVHQAVLHDDFKFNFWQEVHAVFMSMVGLRVSLLPAMTSHFGGRHAIDAVSISAAFTASNLDGWMMASILIIFSP